MSSDPPPLTEFTQETVDHLLSHFDGEGPEQADHIVTSLEAFDAWISERSAAGTHTEAELDRYRAGIWFMRGTIANASGHVDTALSFFQGSIERSERIGDTTRQIISLRSMARCYEYAGMRAESTRCIFEALALAESHGDDRATALALHGLSALYDAQGAYQQLFETAMRTKEIAERAGDPHLLARAYGAVGLSCGWLDRADEGLEWLTKALAVCDAGDLDRTGQIISLYRIFLYSKAGRVDDAVAFANERLDLIATLPKQHAAAVYVDVAEANLAAGNLATAAEMLARADDATDAKMQAHLLRYYLVSADLHSARGDDAAALAMMRLHMQFDDDIRRREAEARLVAMERHFAAEIQAKTEEIRHLRTVELVEKNDQLSDLVQQNEEVLHVVVHDLRNPLAAAQMLGGSLLIDLRGRIDADALDRLHSIGAAAVEMRSTIDSLMGSQRDEIPGTLADVTQKASPNSADAALPGVDVSFPIEAARTLLSELDGTGTNDPAAGVALCEEVQEWLGTQRASSTPEPHLDHMQADLWFMQGMLEHHAGQLDAAIAFLDHSIDLSEEVGHTRRQILGLRSLALCFENMGLQAKSTAIIFEALDLAETFGDDPTLGLVSHAVSGLFQSQGAYGKMVESALRTSEIADRCDDSVLKIRAYNAVAVALAHNGRADEGFAWLDRASALARLEDHLLLHGQLDLNYVFLLQRANRNSEAVALADRRRHSVASLPSAFAATTSVIMAQVYLEAGDLDVAQEMLSQADTAAQNGPLAVHLIEYFATASRLFEAQGDLEAALEMTKQQLRVKGELRGRDAEIRLVALERHFAKELAAKSDEIHHLRTVELVTKNRQLADLVHQKEEILHVVTHDLRNPLAAVQLLGESLMIDLEGSIEDDDMERMVNIRDAAIEMRHTINTLLDGRDAERTSDLTSASAAVRRALDDIGPQAAQRGVAIEPSIVDVDLVVDAALLRRSVDDLLANALASAGAAGTVGVQLRSTGRGARITMTGSGVRFDEHAASGQSLYIARRLVERMNGSLEFSPFTDDTEQTVTIDLRG